jgi:lipopolysaccharide/colanic/teichoic acid biosynthesis glycosyltransferase
MRPQHLAEQRAVDLLVAIPVIVFLGPAILELALAVKLTSPGPAFVAVGGTGIGNSTITRLRLRTCSEGSFRPTIIGLFLRKYSLDQLPEFWSILCGDMSLKDMRYRPVWRDRC